MNNHNVVAPYHVRLSVTNPDGQALYAYLFTENLGQTGGDRLPDPTEITLPASNAEDVLFQEDLTLAQVVAELSTGEPVAFKLQDVGQLIFGYLLRKDSKLEEKWQQVLGQTGAQRQPIRLLIDTSSDAKVDVMRYLPYGLLCEPQRGFLFAPNKAHSISLARTITEYSPRFLTFAQKPLRLLMAVADPPDKRITLPENWLAQLQAIARLPDFEIWICATAGSQRVTGDWQPDNLALFCQTSHVALQNALAQQPFDIVHIIAHGTNGGLFLCDPGNNLKAKMEAATDLGNLFRREDNQPQVQMAFLQVCHASETAGRGGFGGVAQRLLNPECGNLAAVVAAPYPVSAETSTNVATSFYTALADNEHVDLALAESLQQLPEAEWARALFELWVRPQALPDTGLFGEYVYPRPYRGLEAFAEEDAHIFCGRDQDIKQLRELLGAEPIVTVFGPSGSGKSSLLRAGLIPTVRKAGLLGRTDWRIVCRRPGKKPVHDLLRELLAAQYDEFVIDNWLAQPDTLVEYILSKLSTPLLIMLDQFEELFTICADQTQRQTLAQILISLTHAHPDRFRVLIGVRLEFLGHTAALCNCALTKRQYSVNAPNTDDVRHIIADPAKIYNCIVEPALVERIVQDLNLASSPPTAVFLPLLGFTLEQLWLKAGKRLTAQGTLTLNDYTAEDFGGIHGAMNHYADQVYNELMNLRDPQGQLVPNAQAVARQIFNTLVSKITGTRCAQARQKLINEFGPAVPLVIEYFVGKRILTLRDYPDKRADVLVEIAHEVLITGWKKLQDWLALDPAGQKMREAFQHALDTWQTKGYLPDAEAARGFLAWIKTSELNLAQEAENFAAQLAEQVHKDKKRRQQLRRWLIIAAVAAFIAVIAAGVGWVYQQKAKKSEQTAKKEEERALKAEADAQRKALIARARELAVQAKEALAESPQRSLLLAIETLQITSQAKPPLPREVAAEQVLREGLASISGIPLNAVHEDAILLVKDSLDGRYLVTGSADHTVRVWDLLQTADINSSTVLRGHQGQIKDIAISPDNRYIATGSTDRTVRVWDLDPPDVTQSIKVLREQGTVDKVQFSANSRYLITTSDAGDFTRVWDLQATDVMQTVKVLPRGSIGNSILGKINDVASSLDNRYLITINQEKKIAQVWDFQTTNSPRVAIQSLVLDWAFSLDNRSMIVITDDKTVQVWSLDLAEGIQQTNVVEKTLEWTFSSDKHYLVTCRGDNTAQIWDLQAADIAHSARMLQGHQGAIRRVQISPDNRYVITGSADQTARVWDIQTAEEINVLPHNNTVRRVEMTQDSRYVITVTEDLRVRIWDLQDTHVTPHPIELPLEAELQMLKFSPDGRSIITTSSDYTLRIWDFQAPKMSAKVLRHDEQVYPEWSLSTDGRYMLTFSITSGPEDPIYTLRQWDLQADPPNVVKRFENVQYISDSHQGRYVLIRNADNTIAVWDPETANLRDLRGLDDVDDELRNIWFSSNDRYIIGVSGVNPFRDIIGVSDGNDLRLWDLQLPEIKPYVKVLRAQEGWGENQEEAITADSRYVLFSRDDDILRLWDVWAADGPQAGRELQTQVVSWQLDGRNLITESKDGSIWAWDLQSVNGLQRIKVQEQVLAWEISPDGRYLLTGQADLTAQVWDLSVADGPQSVTSLRGHEAPVSTVAWLDPDSRYVLTSSDWKAFWTWDIQTPGVTHPLKILLHHDTVATYSISQDGRYLITVTAAGDTYAWDLQDTQTPPRAITLGNIGEFQVISPNNRYVMAQSGNNLKIWDLQAAYVMSQSGNNLEIGGSPAAEETRAIQEFSDALVSDSSISPDGRYVVIARADDSLQVWDWQTMKLTPLGNMPGMSYGEVEVTSYFSPQSRYLVITRADENTLHLWDLQPANGLPPRDWVLHGHTGGVTHVTFSKDGQYLVTGSTDVVTGSADGRIWALQAEGGIRSAIVLRGFGGGGYVGVSKILISPNSRYIIVADSEYSKDDGHFIDVMRVWELQPERLIERACQLAGRNLTDVEWEQYFQGETYRRTCPDWPVHFTRVQAVVQEGLYSARKGQMDAVRARFTEAKTLNPGIDLDAKLIEAQKLAAAALLAQGDEFTTKEDFPRAIEAYTEAQRLEPALEDIWYKIGKAFYGQKNWDKAIETYQKQVEVTPQHQNAWNSLGNVFWKLGNWEAARDAYQHQVDVNPNLMGAWENLGSALTKVGKSADANDAYQKQIEVYQKQIEMKPDQTVIWNDLWSIFVEQKKWAEAADTYQKFLQRNPQHQDAWGKLSYALLKQGNLPEAANALAKGLNVAPDDVRLLSSDVRLAFLQEDRGRCQARIAAALPFVKPDNRLFAILPFYAYLADPAQGWEPVLTAIAQMDLTKGTFKTWDFDETANALTRLDPKTQQAAQHFIAFFEWKIDLPILKTRLAE